MNISIINSFEDMVSVNGNKIAISFFRNNLQETDITYAGLDLDSNRAANIFFGMGVGKGDRVILYMEKSLAFIVAHIALLKIGAISVPLNPGFKKAEMEYLLKDADAILAISSPKQAGIIKAIDPNMAIIIIDTSAPYQGPDQFGNRGKEIPHAGIRPDDPGVIIYTSGTTGNPKGVVLTHKNLVHDTTNIIQTWEISSYDRVCHALPLYHVHGLCFALHTILGAGAQAFMLDRFSPDTVIDLLGTKEAEKACTIFMAVPTMYSSMMDHVGTREIDFNHIRLWTSGSAPLLAKDFRRIREVFGKAPVEREGMTETGMNFSNPLRGEKRIGSIGLPMPGLQVRIVDPDTHEDCAPGQTGELWLRGPGITPGYWRKPEDTVNAFESEWFRTGDMGRKDEEKYYFLSDRIKHIIISGGENVSPKEIEMVINVLDGVIESSVVGIPDKKWGEKVIAAVVLKDGSALQTEEIRAHCKKHLHDWKCPKEILFLKELPKNRMGKVLKEVLIQIFQGDPV